jgi:hypothetical protein
MRILIMRGDEHYKISLVDARAFHENVQFIGFYDRYPGPFFKLLVQILPTVLSVLDGPFK